MDNTSQILHEAKINISNNKFAEDFIQFHPSDRRNSKRVSFSEKPQIKEYLIESDISSHSREEVFFKRSKSEEENMDPLLSENLDSVLMDITEVGNFSNESRIDPSKTTKNFEKEEILKYLVKPLSISSTFVRMAKDTDRNILMQGDMSFINNIKGSTIKVPLISNEIPFKPSITPQKTSHSSNIMVTNNSLSFSDINSCGQSLNKTSQSIIGMENKRKYSLSNHSTPSLVKESSQPKHFCIDPKRDQDSIREDLISSLMTSVSCIDPIIKEEENFYEETDIELKNSNSLRELYNLIKTKKDIKFGIKSIEEELNFLFEEEISIFSNCNKEKPKLDMSMSTKKEDFVSNKTIIEQLTLLIQRSEGRLFKSTGNEKLKDFLRCEYLKSGDLLLFYNFDQDKFSSFEPFSIYNFIKTHSLKRKLKKDESFDKTKNDAHLKKLFREKKLNVKSIIDKTNSLVERQNDDLHGEISVKSQENTQKLLLFRKNFTEIDNYIKKN